MSVVSVHMPCNSCKKMAHPVLTGVPLLIGFSRVYLGVHFPSDVIGGYIIGAVFFMLFKLF